MPSLADLWDEDKYSEGDPIRQLIAFSKSPKHWGMDALNWGNELIDSATSTIPNKALHTNLQGKLYDPLYGGETSVSASPSEDTQNADRLGRAVNPLLWAGNQKLNTFGLRKMLTDALMEKSGFNASRRAFLGAKEEAMAQPINEAVVDTAAALGQPIAEAMATPMTRRTFNKGLAATGAGVAAGGLLSKFAKAPEIAKAAETLAPATKHKYNTLAEYLDDVTKKTHSDLLDHYPWEKQYNNKTGKDEFISRVQEDNFKKYHSDRVQQRLKQDEADYKASKELYGNKIYEVYPSSGKEPLKYEDVFSPQAKEEMKLWKNLHGDDWHSADLEKWNKFKNPEDGFIHSHDGNYKIFSQDAIDNWGEKDLEPNKIYPQIYSNSGHQAEIVDTGLWNHKGFNTRAEVDDHMKKFWEVANKNKKPIDW